MKILMMTSFGLAPFEEIKVKQFIEGMIKTRKDPPSISTDLNYYIGKIADKYHMSLEVAKVWLQGVHIVSPIAAFNILARQIAIELDKKYEDHIENSEKIYIISNLDGRIHEVCKAHIKNYRNFAAFRTIEDARFACTLLRDTLKGMFKANAKKQ